jgi:hypothetical protein
MLRGRCRLWSELPAGMRPYRKPVVSVEEFSRGVKHTTEVTRSRELQANGWHGLSDDRVGAHISSVGEYHYAATIATLSSPMRAAQDTHYEWAATKRVEDRLTGHTCVGRLCCVEGRPSIFGAACERTRRLILLMRETGLAAERNVSEKHSPGGL